VGSINPDPPHSIRFIVLKEDINEDGNSNCEWKWIELKKKSDSVEEAKKFIDKYSNEITERYKLYQLED
jgi:hypothetical protein